LTVNSSISPISVNLIKKTRKFYKPLYIRIVKTVKNLNNFNRNRSFYLDNLTDIGYI
jgi:hypothetical protein